MKIRSISATPFRIPLAQAISLSTGARGSAEHVLVEVLTEDGVTGHAECVPRPTLYGETFQTAASVIENSLAPLVIGTPVSDLQRLRARLHGVANNATAKAAVELAAFDAFGKTVAQPAHRLLGGFAADIAWARMGTIAPPRSHTASWPPA